MLNAEFVAQRKCRGSRAGVKRLEVVRIKCHARLSKLKLALI